MSWTFSTVQVGGKQMAIASEDLTSLDTSAVWSSEINFIPPGTDFQVIMNTAATNLSSSAHVELFVAYATGSAVAARYRRTDSGFNPVTTEIDTATPVRMVNVSTVGSFPYYFLKINDGGGAVNCRIVYYPSKHQPAT